MQHSHLTAMFDVCVISLSRTPERLVQFRQRFLDYEALIRWLPAVDGQTLNLGLLCDEGLIDSSAMNWTVGQIGCALSHRTAWSQCLEADRPLLVFEDDAMAARCWYQKAHELLVGFAQTEWDLVLLGWNFDSCLQLEWAPGHRFTALFRPRYPSLEELEIALQQSSLPQCFRLNTALGLAGYLVSPGGALKLLEWAFPLRTLPIVTPELPQRQCFSLDGQLNALYSEINAYICFPPLAVGINDQGVSLTRV